MFYVSFIPFQNGPSGDESRGAVLAGPAPRTKLSKKCVISGERNRHVNPINNVESVPWCCALANLAPMGKDLSFARLKGGAVFFVPVVSQRKALFGEISTRDGVWIGVIATGPCFRVYR